MRIILLNLFLVCCQPTFSQKQDAKDIYTIALLNYFDSKPVSIVVSDSTINRHLIDFDYSSMVDNFKGKKYLFNKIADSTWLVELKKADSEKFRLTKGAVKVINKPNLAVRLISKDSIKKSMSTMGHYGFEKEFGVSYLVEFSSIIYLRKKAIVELNLHCGSLCGEGVLIFLEKKNGKWSVVYRQRISVS